MGQMNSSKVGKTISFLRKHYNMTQHELAEKLGVTDKAVSRWENGYGTPDISLLSKLAVALDIDIESLLEGNLTHWGMLWRGVLFLNYAEGITPIDTMYGIRIVEFQMSIMMLAGISDITIYGDKKLIRDVKNVLGDGKKYGCRFRYVIALCSDSNEKEKMLCDLNSRYSLMVIDAACLVFGKDLTKLFRRIIYDGKGITRLLGVDGRQLGIAFYEKAAVCAKTTEHEVRFERGMVTFAVCNKDDLLDAANVLRVFELHMGEKIADMHDIAVRRGMISEKINKL